MHPSIAGVHAEVRARDVARAAADPHHHHVHVSRRSLSISGAAGAPPRRSRSLPDDARQRAGWALIRLGLRFVDQPGHLPSAR